MMKRTLVWMAAGILVGGWITAAVGEGKGNLRYSITVSKFENKAN